MNDFVKSCLNSRIKDYTGVKAGVGLPQNYCAAKAPLQPNPANISEGKTTVFSRPAVGPYADNNLMYSRLLKIADKEGKFLLNQLNQSGKILSRDSNDESSTLQNLYKIATESRLPCFDSRNILKETLKTLADPYIITQNFGEIPFSKMPIILQVENRRINAKISNLKANNAYDPKLEADTGPISEGDIDFWHSSVCPAASIEFNLADKKPAEFTRYVEGLTGPAKSVKTKVKYSDLSPNMMEALGALVDQKSEFKPNSWEKFEVTVQPDENAYIRADIQEDFRTKNSRSVIDVLLQSAFMELGSRNTYNTLTDKRSGDTGEGKGLNQFEIAFVESIVDGNSRKIPLVYMVLNDDITKVTGYNYDFETTKKQFVDSLNSNRNIIVGFMTNMDQKGNLIPSDKPESPGEPETLSGHEVLLTGYRYDQGGKLWFKYNDTDDGDYFKPSWVEADKLIPTVHHANVPESILKEKIQAPEIGYLYLQDYKALKGQK